MALEPRDWRKHGLSYIGHAILGFSVALLASSHPVEAIVLTAAYLAYQGLSYAKRKGTDTPGRDVADFMYGLIIGIIAILPPEIPWQTSTLWRLL